MGCSSSLEIQEKKFASGKRLVYSHEEILRLLKTDLMLGLTNAEAEKRLNVLTNTPPGSIAFDIPPSTDMKQIIRGGKPVMIPSDKIAPGDIILLKPGYVSYNVIVVQGHGMAESNGIKKKNSVFFFSSNCNDCSDVYKGKCFIERGATIISGECRAIIFDTTYLIGQRSTFENLEHF